jgi:hypothetical protein
MLRQNERYRRSVGYGRRRGLASSSCAACEVTRFRLLYYLDEAFPEKPLMPAAPLARAKVRLFNKLIDEYGTIPARS